MGRWKIFIGSKLKTRTFNNQKKEANIGVRVLNQMTEIGAPISNASHEICLG